MSQFICTNCKHLLRDKLDGPCLNCGPAEYNYEANIQHVDKQVLDKLTTIEGY